jgi:protein-disulfide isomerase
MSHALRVLALMSAVMIAIACSSPPPPAEPPTVKLAVAVAPTEPPRPMEEPFVEDPDPGPVPIRAGDPWWGRRDAPVTIVEFADFQCPFSARAQATLAELRQKYGPDQLRIVWKNLPLPFHVKAKPAAIVATMIFERFGNRAFWDVHDAFFGNQKQLADEIDVAAGRLGLSADDVAAMANGSEGEHVDRGVKEANALGPRGTPAFLINGVFLSGAQPVDKFAAIIDEQLAKAAALNARGVPRQRVYAELSKQQWKKAEEASRRPPPPPDTARYLVPIGKSPVRGNKNALVTIIEFAEVQCPFCARVAPTIEQVLAKYGSDVRFVWKHNPLPFHPRAKPAAIFLEEARAQRGDAGFWKAHDFLFGAECVGNPGASQEDCEANNGQWVQHQRHLETSDLLGYAKTLRLNEQRMSRALTSEAHMPKIEDDQGLADDAGASGTPHFFINGKRLAGAQPMEKFVALIDEELATARAMVKKGIKPGKVYETLMATAKGPTPPEKKTVPPPTRDNPSRGPANAKVVVQYFGDLQCPFCRRVHGTIAELEKAFPGKIRVVWRNKPLPMHKYADLAAEAAMEAYRQKGDRAFWSMVEIVYGNQQPGGLERAALEGYGAQLGLDPVRLADALDTSAHKAVIDADVKVSEAAGISGTPAFVINGYFISGAQPLSKFKKVVARALQGK